MAALVLIGAAGEFFTDRPLTWLLLTVSVVLLPGSAYLWVVFELRLGRPRTTA